jgi:predicted DNA-binding transcriptional regulator AlpA
VLIGNKKARLAVVPSLDEIGRDPSLTQGLTSRTRAELIVRASAVIAALAAPLIADQAPALEQHSSPGGDRLLDVNEAATMLGCKLGWLYHSAKDLPFTVRLGPGQLRFSLSGIERFMRAKTVKSVD